MDKTTKKYSLYIENDEGFTCMGEQMVSGLTIDVCFTDEEVATIRQLVNDAEAGKEDNLMPILEGSAPDLYQRIDKAARRAMFDYYLMEAAGEYNIEFDEEEQRENFKKDLESGLFVPDEFVGESDNYSEVPEDEEKLFDLWSEWEYNKFGEEDAAWIRSRYTIDDSSIDVSEEEYICHIPKEWFGLEC